jgi:phosphoadenosine phosphosulfate reductase
MDRAAVLAQHNSRFKELSPQERIEWSLANLPGNHVLSSSFGAQAAVSLHLATQAFPEIPVVLVDTGYLFPETYQFVDELTTRLKLNLKIYRSELTPAWQEARYGQRWQQGVEGIDDYNERNKVAPMRRALRDLEAGTWFAGLRRGQTEARATIPYLSLTGDRWKVHAIADWSNRDVHRHLVKHNLPYHPLWEDGYVSIGDRHSTRSIHDVGEEELTRFNGLKRECGLHEIDLGAL